MNCDCALCEKALDNNLPVFHHFLLGSGRGIVMRRDGPPAVIRPERIKRQPK